MERRVNLAVGMFVILGILALGYLSVKLGRVSFLGASGYLVTADFTSTGGLKAGAAVEIAGVEVGRVESIQLGSEYQARVVTCQFSDASQRLTSATIRKSSYSMLQAGTR